MPSKEQEIRYDALGSAGMRNDVKPERVSDNAVQYMSGLQASRVEGLLMHESGMTELIVSRIPVSGAYPSILNLLHGEIGDTETTIWTGHVSSTVTGIGYEDATHTGTTQVWNPVFFTLDPYTVCNPIAFNRSVHIPLGATYLPMLYYKTPDDVGAAWTADATHYRWAKLGYPELTCDDGAPDGDSGDAAWVPFLYVNNNHNDNQTYPTTKWGGAVGYGGSTSGRTDFDYNCNLGVSETPASEYHWIYGFAGCGDTPPYNGAYPGGMGWGYEASASANTQVWEMREFALGYVYVYHDGTMSEPVVMRWSNSDTVASAYHFVPFRHDTTISSGAAEDEECIIAFRGKIQLPKAVVQREKSILGVRVFYTHNSSKGRNGTVADGYQGWIEEPDIFDNMREVFYVDPDDHAAGMCLLSGATSVNTDPFNTAATCPVYRFNYFLCPCEKTVEYSPSFPNYAGDASASTPPAIDTPMTLGQKWSDIRGDLAERNGIIYTLPRYDDNKYADVASPVVRIYEGGRVVYESAQVADEAFGGIATYNRVTSLPSGVSTIGRGRPDRYACGWSVGCSQGRRMFVSGVRFTHTWDGKTDWNAVYASHIAPDGTPYPCSFPTALRFPIPRGNVQTITPLLDKLVIGTDQTVYIMDLSGGDPTTWSLTDLAVDCGVAGPRAAVSVNNRVYWIGLSGHVYMYELGSAAARQRGTVAAYVVTGGLDGETILVDPVPSTADASICYDAVSDTIVANVTIKYTQAGTGLTVMVDNGNLSVSISKKIILGASVPYRGVTHVTTGDSVYSLSADTHRIYDPPSSVTTGIFSLFGVKEKPDDEINIRSVVDYDMLPSQSGWDEGSEELDPHLKSAKLSVGYLVTNTALTTTGFKYFCMVPVSYPVTISAYDEDHVPGLGAEVSVASDLWTDTTTVSYKSTGCQDLPNAWRVEAPGVAQSYDTPGGIPFDIRKEITVPNGTRRRQIVGVRVSADLQSGSTETIAVTINDPSGRAEFASRTISFATGSVLHTKGSALIPCRGASDRISVKVTGTGVATKSVKIRYVAVTVRDGGRMRIS